MANAIAMKQKALRERVSEQEWSARVELAALYRAMHRLGITDHIYNHISLRVPGEAGHFLINAFGMTYDEVTASSLYKIDIDGNIVTQPDHGFDLNKAGFIIHSAIHSAREDLHCVIHTHTRASIAVGAMKIGLLPISQHATAFLGKISYHDSEGSAVNLSERETLVADLGENEVMFLRNHGTLVCGDTIARTFMNVYFLEMACKIQVDTMAAGDEIVLPSALALENTRVFMSSYRNESTREWDAMKRTLDRTGADYAI